MKDNIYAEGLHILTDFVAYGVLLPEQYLFLINKFEPAFIVKKEANEKAERPNILLTIFYRSVDANLQAAKNYCNHLNSQQGS